MRFRWAIAAVVALSTTLVLIALQYSHSPSSDNPDKQVQDLPASPVDVGNDSAVPTPADRGGTRRTSVITQTPVLEPDASAATLSQRIQAEPDLALTQTNLAESWQVEQYLSATDDVDQIDGATAFAAYEFARSCIGEPRSDDQFEFRLEQYNQYQQDNPNRFTPERLDRAMDRLQDRFLRCEPFDDEDLVKTASDWLILSADLGYLPAQVRFYQELPALLRETQARVFREPGYLDLHRQKSVEYMEQALQSGHPRSFLAVSIALTDGVVFEKDLLAAHAYLTAANLAAGGRDPQMTEMLLRSESDLTPGDLKVAEDWGRNLCWDYCTLNADNEPL